jgi:hypothetical protein
LFGRGGKTHVDLHLKLLLKLSDINKLNINSSADTRKLLNMGIGLIYQFGTALKSEYRVVYFL